MSPPAVAGAAFAAADGAVFAGTAAFAAEVVADLFAAEFAGGVGRACAKLVPPRCGALNPLRTTPNPNKPNAKVINSFADFFIG